MLGDAGSCADEVAAEGNEDDEEGRPPAPSEHAHEDREHRDTCRVRVQVLARDLGLRDRDEPEREQHVDERWPQALHEREHGLKLARRRRDRIHSKVEIGSTPRLRSRAEVRSSRRRRGEGESLA